jgi:hypothetical protein
MAKKKTVSKTEKFLNSSKFQGYINWLIIYRITSQSRIVHLYGDITIAGEGLQNLGLITLGAQGLWAGRNLYCATPALKRNLDFPGLIRRTAPFRRLLRHTRWCGGWSINSNPDPHRARDIQTLKRASTPVARYGTLSAWYGSFSARYGSCTVRYAFCMVRYASCMVRYASCTVRFVSCTVRFVSCTVRFVQTCCTLC